MAALGALCTVPILTRYTCSSTVQSSLGSGFAYVFRLNPATASQAATSPLVRSGSPAFTACFSQTFARTRHCLGVARRFTELIRGTSHATNINTGDINAVSAAEFKRERSARCREPRQLNCPLPRAGQSWLPGVASPHRRRRACLMEGLAVPRWCRDHGRRGRRSLTLAPL